MPWCGFTLMHASFCGREYVCTYLYMFLVAQTLTCVINISGRLLHRSFSSFTPGTYLSVGSEASNYVQEINVVVSDRFGAQVTVTLSVKVG